VQGVCAPSCLALGRPGARKDWGAAVRVITHERVGAWRHTRIRNHEPPGRCPSGCTGPSNCVAASPRPHPNPCTTPFNCTTTCWSRARADPPPPPGSTDPPSAPTLPHTVAAVQLPCFTTHPHRHLPLHPIPLRMCQCGQDAVDGLVVSITLRPAAQPAHASTSSSDAGSGIRSSTQRCALRRRQQLPMPPGCPS
jgi:hypothetical protein